MNLLMRLTFSLLFRFNNFELNCDNLNLMQKVHPFKVSFVAHEWWAITITNIMRGNLMSMFSLPGPGCQTVKQMVWNLCYLQNVIPFNFCLKNYCLSSNFTIFHFSSLLFFITINTLVPRLIFLYTYLALQAVANHVPEAFRHYQCPPVQPRVQTEL